MDIWQYSQPPYLEKLLYEAEEEKKEKEQRERDGGRRHSRRQTFGLPISAWEKNRASVLLSTACTMKNRRARNQNCHAHIQKNEPTVVYKINNIFFKGDLYERARQNIELHLHKRSK